MSDGSRAYIPSENGATLAVVDGRGLTLIKTIPLGEGMRPMGVVMSPDDSRLYISTGRSRMVLIVDTATDQVVGSVDVGPRPWGIAVSPDGKTLFTANGPSNDVSVVDIATRQVTKKIPVGEGPWGLAFVQRPPL
jgi:YVTN family beta-propeller protein